MVAVVLVEEGEREAVVFVVVVMEVEVDIVITVISLLLPLRDLFSKFLEPQRR